MCLLVLLHVHQIVYSFPGDRKAWSNHNRGTPQPDVMTENINWRIQN